ncbi:DUF3265 domain-containing protein [Vibrio vulnificus]|nr:DUF3265 domain-containing protein [Vibrio vulnificus]RZP71814.1 DUF3265 domain-containing protein [Vibrio vulnificus]
MCTNVSTSVGVGQLTNASRGTANAWHFYYALVFVVTTLCRK